MPLSIETFSNASGGSGFFKAIAHPLAAEKATALLGRLRDKGEVAIYDPHNRAAALNALYDIASLPLAGYFIQDVERQDSVFGGCRASLVTEIGSLRAKQLLITEFNAEKLYNDIRHLLPAGVEVTTLDAMRIPEFMQTERRSYLSVINFATNFAFFREANGHHTRLVTANYWSGYGAEEPAFWCRLYDGDGKVLAEWVEQLGPAQSAVIIDSRKIRARFQLPEFTGQLFIHAFGIAGHDVVKYALDTYGDDDHVLSCTHDANAWPADLYAGLPAPDESEDVTLWVQNSHPTAIPAGEVGINVMGRRERVALLTEVAPFATTRLQVRELLPDAQWPQQIEVSAGKYFVRPRYEVWKNGGRQRIAHANVERTDLRPDPKLAKLGNVLGKGYILPAPVLPPDRFSSLILPTPMATGQNSLPLTALVYDAGGSLAFQQRLGNLPRDHVTLFDVGAQLHANGKTLPAGYGHVELIYDFGIGIEADGWLHGLFRYVDRKSSHIAESSFGSHIFNTVLTYKNEPQSYGGRPPGLSTRLFLRVGQDPYDTFCHLIYPASTPWRPHSDTALTLLDRNGKEVDTQRVRIPCSGSRLWRVSEVFSAAHRAAAGGGGYVIVRDTTCRLFGYHGLLHEDHAFSLDHMFGF